MAIPPRGIYNQPPQVPPVTFPAGIQPPSTTTAAVSKLVWVEKNGKRELLYADLKSKIHCGHSGCTKTLSFVQSQIHCLCGKSLCYTHKDPLSHRCTYNHERRLDEMRQAENATRPFNDNKFVGGSGGHTA